MEKIIVCGLLKAGYVFEDEDGDDDEEEGLGETEDEGGIEDEIVDEAGANSN